MKQVKEISGLLARHRAKLDKGLRTAASALAAGATVGTFLLPGGAASAAPVAGHSASKATAAMSVGSAARARCPKRPSTPVRVSVPAIRVHADVLSINLHGDQLDPPPNWHQVGWWRQSTKPGLALGKTVMTGHTTHWKTDGGVFNSLGSVKKGQDVLVATKNNCTVDYRVTSVKNYSHSQLASRAKSIFGQTTGHGNLVLITCGAYDGHEYHTNIVVTAKPRGWVL